MFDMTPEMLLGTPTIHIPINFILQKVGDEQKIAGIFQSANGKALEFGSHKCHQLVIADAFIRPQLVFETDELRGCGITSLYTSAWMEREKWQRGLIFDRNQ